MTDKISVIVPAYNCEKYINRTINSICAQTYKNLEIIIVDDGSNDDTFNICKELALKDNRIKVFTKCNEGVTKARNFGVLKASGEYITFVDSDDTVEPEMYENLYNNIKKYNADISHCGYKLISANKDIQYFHNTLKLKEQDTQTGIIDLIEGLLVEPTLCTKLYSKKLFENLQYDLSLRINEDYVLNLCLFKKSCKSVFEDKPYYNYYQNENSGSTKNTKEYFYRDILKAADITKSMFQDDDDLFPYAQRRWFRTYSSMYKNQYSYNFDKLEFDMKKLLSEILLKVQSQYNELRKNKLLTFSDKFILFTIKHCPKLLVFICKIR
jgi:glycosyltransferase involved in cell wall biosynthesis